MGADQAMPGGSPHPQIPQVSVVIPAHRAERSIRRAVESALRQPDVEPQPIVVVDGLLDRTREALADLGGRVELIVHPEPRGAQASRNAGLAAATGEFVMFLDADDFLEGRLLAGLAERMHSAGADVGFGPMQRLFEASGTRRLPYRPSFSSAEDVLRSWLVGGLFVPPCSVLWRTAYLRRIGGWDEGIARNQDGELAMRAILLGAQFATSPEGRGIYVQHESERITRRPDNLPALMDVANKLLALESPVVDRGTQAQIIGAHLYNVAACYHQFDRPDLARQALQQARALGFRGHGGPLWHRILCRLLGLRRRYRLTSFLKRLYPGLTTARS